MKNWKQNLWVWIAVLFYLSSTLLFVTGSDSSLKIITLCLGSFCSCMFSTQLNKQNQQEEDDQEE